MLDSIRISQKKAYWRHLARKSHSFQPTLLKLKPLASGLRILFHHRFMPATPLNRKAPVTEPVHKTPLLGYASLLTTITRSTHDPDTVKRGDDQRHRNRISSCPSISIRLTGVAGVFRGTRFCHYPKCVIRNGNSTCDIAHLGLS